MSGWIHVWVNGCIEGGMDVCMGWMHGGTDAWRDGCMEGWMNGGTD